MAGALVAAMVLAGCADSLHDVVARGDLETAQAMLKADPSLVNGRNELGKTPLDYAVTFKQLGAMELLVRHGADVNAADNTGMTPLHVAAMFGRKAEAQWLVDHGASVEARDIYGDTPMHTAAIWNHGQIIQVLIAKGASLTEGNAKGKTPLDLARANRQTKVARFIEKLIAEGAG
jgi:ankyrin repeat protein